MKIDADEMIRKNPFLAMQEAADIVDAVLAISAAIDSAGDISAADLADLFSVALRGGLEYSAIKMTMVALGLEIANARLTSDPKKRRA